MRPLPLFCVSTASQRRKQVSDETRLLRLNNPCAYSYSMTSLEIVARERWTVSYISYHVCPLLSRSPSKQPKWTAASILPSVRTNWPLADIMKYNILICLKPYAVEFFPLSWYTENSFSDKIYWQRYLTCHHIYLKQQLVKRCVICATESIVKLSTNK
jgi:hypothetical protein